MPDYREPFGPQWAPTGNTPEAREKRRIEIQTAAWLHDADQPSRIDWDYEVSE